MLHYIGIVIGAAGLIAMLRPPEFIKNRLKGRLFGLALFCCGMLVSLVAES